MLDLEIKQFIEDSISDIEEGNFTSLYKILFDECYTNDQVAEFTTVIQSSGIELDLVTQRDPLVRNLAYLKKSDQSLGDFYEYLNIGRNTFGCSLEEFQEIVGRYVV